MGQHIIKMGTQDKWETSMASGTAPIQKCDKTYYKMTSATTSMTTGTSHMTNRTISRHL